MQGADNMSVNGFKRFDLFVMPPFMRGLVGGFNVHANDIILI